MAQAMPDTQTGRDATERLLDFLAGLRANDLPAPVLERTALLFMDWVACTLAGARSRPVEVLSAFARRMGPADGPAEVLPWPGASSAFFAALVNGAASHAVEQDDLHGPSVVHPATVVFPAALAAAQEAGASGRELLAAAVVGYEAACRAGAYLGPSHYRHFHTTGTAGTLGAAAAVGHLLGLSRERFGHAFGLAGTQAAGLWEFLRTDADSKQLHTGKAAADGLLGAYAAADGMRGARRILEGDQGLGAAASRGPDPSRLDSGLGERWAVLETAFKWHAACRHTHPAVDALVGGLARNGLRADDVRRVTARVHAAALDVLGPVTAPTTPHQAKFSMPFVLATAVVRGHAGVDDFGEASLDDPAILAFADRVDMVLDPEIDADYPARWRGRVDIETVAGRHLRSEVEAARGEPDNPLTLDEVAMKARGLIAHGGLLGPDAADVLLARVAAIADAAPIGRLLDGAAS